MIRYQSIMVVIGIIFYFHTIGPNSCLSKSPVFFKRICPSTPGIPRVFIIMFVKKESSKDTDILYDILILNFFTF